MRSLYVATGLLALILMAPCGAQAQETPVADPTVATPEVVTPQITADAKTLARIREALGVPAISLAAATPRFYMLVQPKWPTFAEYLKATGGDLRITPIIAPGTRPILGGGAGISFDPADIKRAFRAAVEAYQTKQIRARIDAELKALAGDADDTKPGSAEGR
jgi:hypothetical protein